MKKHLINILLKWLDILGWINPLNMPVSFKTVEITCNDFERIDLQHECMFPAHITPSEARHDLCHGFAGKLSKLIYENMEVSLNKNYRYDPLVKEYCARFTLYIRKNED